MAAIHAPDEARLDSRQLTLPVILALALLLFLLRLWYLQAVDASDLEESAERTGTVSSEKLAPRGRIVDRNGVLLAGVRAEVVVTAVPAIASKDPAAMQKVADLLKIPVEKIQKILKLSAAKAYLPVPIYVGAPVEVATKIAELGDTLKGFGVETQPMRYYTDTTSAAHVLGWVWTPSENDIKRLESRGIDDPAEYVGRDGLEAQYENLLMGQRGNEEMRVDARRRPLRSMGANNPVPGKELVLTLDMALQKAALKLLEGHLGAAVAIEPSTGEVLCLASCPTFDTALYRGGIKAEDFEMLNEDPTKPLLKRAVSGIYAPGSTFKVITTMAALMEGKFSPYTTVVCNGSYKLGNRKFACTGHHGRVSFHEAFAKSCNTYFMDLAHRVGPEALCKAALAVGLGTKTGIDLPGENVGIIPTDDWLARKKLKWYGGDTVNTGIGQGYVETTPLQMACLAALVANGGTSYKPHLLKKTVGRDGETTFDRQQLAHFDAPASFWAELRSAMIEVIDTGTAKTAQIRGLTWGGKTGSSQNIHGIKTHSWFIGYAPIDHPRIAIAVIVENAGHGGTIAAPMARQLVKQYLSGHGEKVEVQAAPADETPAEQP